MKEIILIGSDHAGFRLKEKIKIYLKKNKFKFVDFGVFDTKRFDYPDIAVKVASEVAKSNKRKGILICGTGTGMVIAANKVKGIRAAMCHDNYSAKMARQHNDANILCLRSRRFSSKKAISIFRVWISTKFSNKSRHKRRIKKISRIER